MFHDFSYINGVLWAVVGIIMIIGNLTYADYYTKLNEKFLNNFWCTYCICMGAAIVNFVITFVIDSFVDTNDSPSPLNYGLGWLAVMSMMVYTVSIIWVISIGYCKLKRYFGRKRNKI